MKVATSILSVDFNNLGKEIKSLSKSDFLHLDVMDGEFVPNISFGYPVLKNIPNISSVPLDVHLMIQNPLNYIDDFSKLNPEYITIHIEANKPKETIKKIKENNIKVGLSLKPKTDIAKLSDYIDEIDLVLIMTVEPGFGGQKFMKEQLDKVRELDKLRRDHNYKYLIQIDGGVNAETIKYIKGTGVDIVVAGSYIIDHKNKEQAIKSLKWK